MTQGVFSGQTIIVTGAEGGVGQAIVQAFAEQGGRVISTDLRIAEKGDGAKAGLIIKRRLDVSSEGEWIALFDEVERLYGRVDVVVNNAGFYKQNIAFEEMPLDVWQQHFRINADGVFLGCKHAIRRMKAHGAGAIVNIGSGMSLRGSPTGSAYSASKAAVLMTTRTAAKAAGKYGIRVNAVLPGAVPTDMLMGNVLPDETQAQFLARMGSFSALGRLAEARDIARGVLFLADPANASISGVYLPIDGGAMPEG